MFAKGRIPLLLLSIATALLSARAAHACSCGPQPTVLEEFNESDVVVILRAVSVEKAEKPEAGDEGPYYAEGVKTTTTRVERVYKGAVKVGDELTFAQGGGGDCVWTFNEESVGRRYLFYLTRPEKGRKLWRAFGCGRSRGLEGAHEDLLYLNKLDKVRGRTRVSGTIEFVDYGQNVSIAGRRVRLVGASKTYEAKLPFPFCTKASR